MGHVGEVSALGCGAGGHRLSTYACGRTRSGARIAAKCRVRMRASTIIATLAAAAAIAACGDDSEPAPTTSVTLPSETATTTSADPEPDPARRRPSRPSPTPRPRPPRPIPGSTPANAPRRARCASTWPRSMRATRRPPARCWRPARSTRSPLPEPRGDCPASLAASIGYRDPRGLPYGKGPRSRAPGDRDHRRRRRGEGGSDRGHHVRRPRRALGRGRRRLPGSCRRPVARGPAEHDPLPCSWDRRRPTLGDLAPELSRPTLAGTAEGFPGVIPDCTAAAETERWPPSPRRKDRCERARDPDRRPADRQRPRPAPRLRRGRGRGEGPRRDHRRPSRRRPDRDHGPLGLGQVDPDALPRRPRPPDLGQGDRRRRRPRRASTTAS